MQAILQRERNIGKGLNC